MVLNNTRISSEVIDEVDVIMEFKELSLNDTMKSILNHSMSMQKDYCITKEVLGERDILLFTSRSSPIRNVDISDEMLKTHVAKYYNKSLTVWQ